MSISRKITLFLIIILGSTFLYADIFKEKKDSDFLPSYEAFKVSAVVDKNKINIFFQIADGYYLYKDKIYIESNYIQSSKIIFPKHKIFEDEFFGKSKIFDKDFQLGIEYELVNNLDNDKSKYFFIHYQGCAIKGLCYPPEKKNIPLNLSSDILINNNPAKFKSEQMEISEKIVSENILMSSLLFLGLGILLSFTPCVLPMVPILSGILLKSNDLGTDKKSFLSIYYVLGLVFVYTLIGFLLGFTSSSNNIQILFQHPISILLFASILILLAFSMFGFYKFQISSNIQNWAANLSKKLNSGDKFGAIVMGSLSALIIGPCVGPPLAGLFIYITTTNVDPFVPPLLLFNLSVGMGIPLILYGFLMGKFLPKVGGWMKFVNYFFGILLILASIILIDRVFPIFSFDNNDDRNNLSFETVGSIKSLEDSIKSHNQYIMIGVYADWCIECKRMEAITFKDIDVQNSLRQFKLIKVDVTENSDMDKDMLEYFGILGPPAYFFYHKNNRIEQFDIQGYLGPKSFVDHVFLLKEFER
ncbi:MAG: hypothetical protein CMD90_00300 [Gammaproteobacteria bacterium]|nr:hypothetical protein [Gammaproteobacteria bacterium]